MQQCEDKLNRKTAHFRLPSDNMPLQFRQHSWACMVSFPRRRGNKNAFNDVDLMLIGMKLHMRSSEVSIKRRSTPASHSFKGQATKYTTVK